MARDSGLFGPQFRRLGRRTIGAKAARRLASGGADTGRGGARSVQRLSIILDRRLIALGSAPDPPPISRRSKTDDKHDGEGDHQGHEGGHGGTPSTTRDNHKGHKGHKGGAGGTRAGLEGRRGGRSRRARRGTRRDTKHDQWDITRARAEPAPTLCRYDYPLAVLSAVADPQIRPNPRNPRFPLVVLRGPRPRTLCALCGLCDFPFPPCFVSLRVPLRGLRDLPPWQSCAGHARAPFVFFVA